MNGFKTCPFLLLRVLAGSNKHSPGVQADILLGHSTHKMYSDKNLLQFEI